MSSEGNGPTLAMPVSADRWDVQAIVKGTANGTESGVARENVCMRLAHRALRLAGEMGLLRQTSPTRQTLDLVESVYRMLGSRSGL